MQDARSEINTEAQVYMDAGHLEMHIIMVRMHGMNSHAKMHVCADAGQLVLDTTLFSLRQKDSRQCRRTDPFRCIRCGIVHHILSLPGK